MTTPTEPSPASSDAPVRAISHRRRHKPWWWKAAAAVAEGQADGKAAKFAGVHLTSLRSICKSPEFIDMVQAAYEEWMKVGMKAIVRRIVSDREHEAEDVRTKQQTFGKETQGL